jgi:signal transduction histidine kinase
MQKYLSPTLIKIKNFMLVLNFCIISLLASIVLFSTKYICETQAARHFLDNVTALPYNPDKVFFTSIGAFIILTILIYIRSNKENRSVSFLFYTSVLEIILCFTIIQSLYMSYNGIVFLVFIDIIIHMKENNKTIWFIIILIFIIVATNYDIASSITPILSINNYISVFSHYTSTILLLITHGLDAINSILFIIFMIVFITNQGQENERISSELLMINQVNTSLKEYAKISEKMGEDNERKRLAREIHDTLGHALTGVAAGVDACIAMIDISPEETKKQLFVISKVVRQGISDVRNSLNKLRPGALEEHTFKESIVKLINEFKDVSSIDIDLVYEVDKIDFENTKEDVLFRIIQESMTNALRHGHATYINIHIYIKDNDFIIEIKDNGEGCKDIQLGYGLKHMQERVSFFDGHVEFNGDNGFYTYISIPIKRGEKYD